MSVAVASTMAVPMTVMVAAVLFVTVVIMAASAFPARIVAAHKIDGLVTRLVATTVTTPVFVVSGWHVHVNGAHLVGRAGRNDHGLGVDHSRWGLVADVDAAVDRVDSLTRSHPHRYGRLR